MIPTELKTFNLLCGYGTWLTLILASVWFVFTLHRMICRKRGFWLWLLILPCVIGRFRSDSPGADSITA